MSVAGDAEAVLLASRALLGVVARSLSDALERVTLPQFRALVILRAEGPVRVGRLSRRLAVNPSTFSRFLDRLEEDGWVARTTRPGNRREVLVALTDAGRELVDQVSARRAEELGTILHRMGATQRAELTGAMSAFAAAAGESSEHDLDVLGL